ncbi:MAG: phosphatase PAP2 family protein [bacterium]|nr:MAG: phosphatase PAP2 family protein [bacterium]
MKRAIQIIIYLVTITFPCSPTAQLKSACKLKDSIISDYKKFYSIQNLGKLTIGIGISGVFANSSADQEIQDFYNDYIKNGTTDDISKIVKPFGDGRITVPVYLTAVLIGELTKDTRIGSAVGEWGQRCSRALIVGAPPVLTLQIVLGASRPEEGKGSHWHPFKDNNGVSGHSFMGAVPFLTAAKMTDNRFLKYSLYLGSTLTGLSRINDNKHYFSQSLLGWWIAYLAVNSIDLKKFVLVPSANIIGVGLYF